MLSGVSSTSRKFPGSPGNPLYRFPPLLRSPRGARE